MWITQTSYTLETVNIKQDIFDKKFNCNYAAKMSKLQIIRGLGPQALDRLDPSTGPTTNA